MTTLVLLIEKAFKGILIPLRHGKVVFSEHFIGTALRPLCLRGSAHLVHLQPVFLLLHVRLRVHPALNGCWLCPDVGDTEAELAGKLIVFLYASCAHVST